MAANLACKSNEALGKTWPPPCALSYACAECAPVCVKSCMESAGPRGAGPSLALVRCAKRTLGARGASWGQMELLCGKSG